VLSASTGPRPTPTIPLRRACTAHEWRRRVALDGLVTIETNRYSVPATYIGQEVDVLEGSMTRCAFIGTGQLIAAQAQ